MPRPGDVMVGGARRRRMRWVVGGLVLVVALVAGAALARDAFRGDQGTAAAEQEPESPEAEALAVAEEFLSAWAAEDFERLQSFTLDPSLDAATVHAEADRVLRIAEATYTAGEAAIADGEANVPFEASWVLEGLGEYRFASSLNLRRPEPERGFAVDWWYTVVHPDLDADRSFERVRDRRPRAPILAADGTAIVQTAEVVTVGVRPERVEDPQAVVEALTTLAGADSGETAAVLERDDLDPAGFYPLAELPLASFDEVRDQLFPVPGVTFETSPTREGEVPESARRLVGGLGEITAELLDELGAPYRQGDIVGTSGLERAYELQLAGEPRQEALITGPSGIVESLLFVDGAEPEAVETTLDFGLQAAAERALGGTAQPAALVAVDNTTGEIRAAVSTPLTEFDRALGGQYPPGSTFKVATAVAALAGGLTPETVVDCPPEVTIGGRELGNAGDLGPGEITLAEAVALSCNTAFAQVGANLGGEAVTAAAARFGFNTDYSMGLPSAGGSFPEPADAAELAAASFGQGRVVASPAHMASVAAAAATGTWRAPHLVRGAELEVAEPLDPAYQAALAGMLRLVVTDGTGTAADLAGEPVFGKTGSAEFGTGDELATHAWFIGYRGSLAVAVFVEGGGGGGAVAAPIAASFFSELMVGADAPP